MTKPNDSFCKSNLPANSFLAMILSPPYGTLIVDMLVLATVPIATDPWRIIDLTKITEVCSHEVFLWSNTLLPNPKWGSFQKA
jgi:hypothetical protein